MAWHSFLMNYTRWFCLYKLVSCSLFICWSPKGEMVTSLNNLPSEQSLQKNCGGEYHNIDPTKTLCARDMQSYKEVSHTLQGQVIKPFFFLVLERKEHVMELYFITFINCWFWSVYFRNLHCACFGTLLRGVNRRHLELQEVSCSWNLSSHNASFKLQGKFSYQ